MAIQKFTGTFSSLQDANGDPILQITDAQNNPVPDPRPGKAATMEFANPAAGTITMFLFDDWNQFQSVQDHINQAVLQTVEGAYEAQHNG